MESVYVVIREEREDVDLGDPRSILWEGMVPLGGQVCGITLPASEGRPNAALPTVMRVGAGRAVPRRLTERDALIEESLRAATATYPGHDHDGFLAGEKCPDCGHVFVRDYGIGG